MKYNIPDIDLKLRLDRLKGAFVARVRPEKDSQAKICVCIPVEQYGIDVSQGIDKGVPLSIHLFRRTDVSEEYPYEYVAAILTAEDFSSRAYKGRSLWMVGKGMISSFFKHLAYRQELVDAVHDKFLPVITDPDVGDPEPENPWDLKHPYDKAF